MAGASRGVARGQVWKGACLPRPGDVGSDRPAVRGVEYRRERERTDGGADKSRVIISNKRKAPTFSFTKHKEPR